MKTTITAKPSSIEHAFPAFYKDNDSDMVVLFASLTTGIVVRAGGNFGEGDWDDDWPDADDTSEWTRLPTGTVVTLEQA